MFAIRDDREYVNQEDLTKAARKVGEAKKHESRLLVSQNVTVPPDPGVHSKDGVLNVIYSIVYIPFLFSYTRFATFLQTVTPLYIALHPASSIVRYYVLKPHSSTKPG